MKKKVYPKHTPLNAARMFPNKNGSSHVSSALETPLLGETGPMMRVLCLHGFRQTAEGFYGRTHSFRKSLRSIVKQFDFLEAPFILDAVFVEEMQEERECMGEEVKEESVSIGVADDRAGVRDSFPSSSSQQTFSSHSRRNHAQARYDISQLRPDSAEPLKFQGKFLGKLTDGSYRQINFSFVFPLLNITGAGGEETEIDGQEVLQSSLVFPRPKLDCDQGKCLQFVYRDSGKTLTYFAATDAARQEWCRLLRMAKAELGKRQARNVRPFARAVKKDVDKDEPARGQRGGEGVRHAGGGIRRCWWREISTSSGSVINKKIAL